MVKNVDEIKSHMHDYEAHVRAVEEDLEYYRTKRFESRIIYLARRGVVTFYDLLKAHSSLRRKKVKGKNPQSNPRTPGYIRGKEGVITAVHGVIDNPRDHRGLYPPLYTVAFAVQDLFGGTSSDKLWVDIHEEWLEAG